jgi:hypothetical protein
MKIGGTGEFWMIIGPIIAIVLVMTFTSGGPDDMLRIAERAANELWNGAAQMLRR